ncbi:hypothetical protein GUJ93_ZPchr0013g33861 [Zizania palustris]|uniref:Uncharacterized protein n=1 Tax=Zizania palustris TaxID=103762 RepID=A0A8J6C214_ZIZPA|nr:hypothetical protein GUJ93_ZPchr0013g33861 [Zizania palustris]
MVSSFSKAGLGSNDMCPVLAGKGQSVPLGFWMGQMRVPVARSLSALVRQSEQSPSLQIAGSAPTKSLQRLISDRVGCIVNSGLNFVGSRASSPSRRPLRGGAAEGTLIPVARAFNTLKNTISYPACKSMQQAARITAGHLISRPQGAKCSRGSATKPPRESFRPKQLKSTLVTPFCCSLPGHACSRCIFWKLPCSRWVPKLSPSLPSSSNSQVLDLVPFSAGPSSQAPFGSSGAVLAPEMANFPVDPIFFVPRGGVLADGGGELRKRRSVVTLTGATDQEE